GRYTTSPVHDRYKSGEGYHDVPPPYTGTFMPPKLDLVFHDAPTASETVPNVFNVESSTAKPTKEMSQSNRPSAPIIEDWVSDLEDEYEGEPVPTQKAPSFVQTSELVKTPRTSVKPVEHPTQAENLRKVILKSRAKNVVNKPHSPIRRPINHRSSPKDSNFHQKVTTVKAKQVNDVQGVKGNWGNSQQALKDKGVIDSGCSRHITGKISYLSDFKEIDGGYVVFGGNLKGSKITCKGKIRTGKLDFDDVYFVKELKFNLFSVSQMCDKKNSVLFTNTECVVLSFDFKLLDDNHVLLRVPKENNMYNVDLKNIVNSGDLTCLFAKATLDKSNLWHIRLGHINFKTINKLVKGNLVRGLPSKVFENNHTCVACKKSKQHRAFCKSKPVSSVIQSLQRLHIDLFGPTFVKSLNKKSYCLVVTDDNSRFSWVFFMATKDETSTILKNFITGIENQINYKVKIIRSDNETKFKNHDLNQFCRMKGIKREFSVARTPQQNGVAERKNRTLIEAARTMLADSLLPILFWAEAVNIACYVQNRVLVTKPHNKTPYELLLGRTPSIGFMRPFGRPVTLLNTLDPLGKFNGKADEGFLVGYSVSSKAFSVFNSRTKIVQETLHIKFLENQPNVVGNGPTWLFDIDTLTQSMNYQPVVAGNQPNHNAGIQENLDAVPQNTYVDVAFDDKENESEVHVSPSSSDKPKKHYEKAKREAKGKNDEEVVGAEADFSNLETSITVSPILTTKVHKDHPITQIIGDLSSAPQTRNLPKGKRAIGSKWVFKNKKDKRGIVVRNKARLVAQGHTQEEGIDYEEVFAPVARIEAIRLFLAYAFFMGFMVYQMNVKIAFLYETIEEEVYICQPLGFEDPDYLDKVYRVVKALYRLHQALRAWFETLANYFLENDFQKGKIDQTLFIKKQKGDILLVQVYVDDIIFRSTNKELCKAFEKLMKDKFQMSSMGELTFFLGLQVKQKDNGIFISQDKYIAKILRKFGLTDGKSASTPIDTEKPLLKDPDGEDVDVNIYMSMIGSLMYLTSSRPDIMFAVCACARFQVTPKVSHLHAVKRIFSDYARASLNKKSTTGGCQFLGCRLISWQCKKQTVVATSSTEAEYVAIASCCAQVLWIQNLIIIDVSYTLMLFGLTKDVVYLMLLGHKKKVIITEDTIRQALRLDDAAGIDCLPNEEIFAELARMGYEKPSTNSSMDLVVICLATCRKFNFSKYIFDSMDVEDAAEDEDVDNEVSTEPTPPSPTPTTPPPSPTQEHIPSPPQAQTTQPSSPPQQPSQTHKGLNPQLILLWMIRRMHPNKREIAELDDDEDVTLVDAKEDMNADVQGRLAESQAKVCHLDLQHTKKVLSMQDTDEADPAEVEEVIKVVIAAKLMKKVVTTAATTIIAAQVPKASAPRRRRGVVIQDPEETATASVIMHTKVKSKDKGKGILIEESKPLKRQAQIEQDEALLDIIRCQALKRKPVTEAQARKNMMIYFKNMVGFKMDFFKWMTYNEIRPIFVKHYNLNQAFLERVKEERINEEEEELKAQLQIVVNDDDDVFTEATPITSKSLHHNTHNYSDDSASGKEIPFDTLHFGTKVKNVRLEVEEESEMSLELLSFGVDAVEDFKKICKGITAAG
nr:retrovirus-related Pol polyprotein from transposon TNT 1-94 [Tanacetum cinerariifolium]